MKYIFIILICFLGIAGYSQPITNRANSITTVQDARLKALLNLYIPLYLDTTQANTNKGLDTTGAIIYTYTGNTLWYRTVFKGWVSLSSSSGSSVNIYNSDGELTGNRTIKGDNLNLLFDSLAIGTLMSRGNSSADSSFLTVDNTNNLATQVGYNSGGATSLVSVEPNLATLEHTNNGLISSFQANQSGQAGIRADDKLSLITNGSGGFEIQSTNAQPIVFQREGGGSVYLFTNTNVNSLFRVNSSTARFIDTLNNKYIDIVPNSAGVAINLTGSAPLFINNQSVGANTINTNAQTINGNNVAQNSTRNAVVLSEWRSTTMGLLFPRMTGAQMNAIINPPTGMIVQCTDSSNSPICYYTGSGWRKFLSQTGGNATLTGVINVTVDTATNSICTQFADSSVSCYPLSGDSVRIVGDTSICVYTNGSSDCFVSVGDTFVTAGGIDSVTIIGNVFCIWSVGSSDCVNINNSNGFVTTATLNADSTAYDFYSGGTYLFSLPTLLRSLYAGSGILINDTTIDGRATTVIYNIGGSGGTPGIDDVLAENQTLTAMRSINAGGFDFNIENADFLNLQATNDIGLNSLNNGISLVSKNPTSILVNGNNSLLIDTTKTVFTDLDSTTRVGINTGAPQAALHVRGDGSITAAFMNGNVGIGTTTPTATEHLVGTFRYEDGNEAAGAVLTSDVNGNATWEMPTIDTVPTTHYWGAFGQSNMEEQSPAGDSLYKKDWTPNPQVQVYVSGSWVTANRYTNNIATGAIPVRENSVVVAAQQYLLNHPYDTIRIITSIQSNTALSSWTKPQTGFGEKDTVNHMFYITDTKLTTQIPSGSYLECIFWQQGEKNEQDTTTNAYMYMMKALDSTYKVYSTVSPNLRQIFAYPTTTYPAMRAVFDSVRRNVIDLTGHDFGVVTHDYSTGVDATHLNGYQTAMVGMAFNINFQYRYTNLTNIPWAVRAGSANGDTTISIKPVVSNAGAVSVTFGNGTTRFVNKPVEIQTNLAVNGGNIYTSGTNFTYTTATTGGQYKAASTSSTSYTTVVGYEAYLGGFTSVRGAAFYGFTDGTGGGGKILTSSSGASFNTQTAWFDRAGRTGLGTGISSSVLPSAWLTLSPGAAAASGAPLKFLSGTNLTTPENGAVEYNGTDYFATSGGVRYTLQRVTTVPASAGATGVTGSIAYDSSFIYVCVATNTWVRAALATW